MNIELASKDLQAGSLHRPIPAHFDTASRERQRSEFRFQATEGLRALWDEPVTRQDGTEGNEGN